MTLIWQDALEEAWTELARHEPAFRQFRTRRLSDDVGLDFFAALRDVDDGPCLVIDAEVPPESLFEVGGMRLSVAPGDRGPLLVLSLEDSTRKDLFRTLCADAISASQSGEKGNELATFLARLDAWRRFLREHHVGLSREEIIGLLGELFVLEGLVFRHPDTWRSWEAPDSGLHDFHLRGHSLEVKTSLRPSSRVHISSLDQLETDGLRRLDLLHVHLFEAAEGRSVADLVSDISARLADDATRRALENALLQRGLMPDDTLARTRPRVQLHSIDAYRIEDGFPRIARSALSTAIIDAAYTVDLRAVTGPAAEGVLDDFAREAAA